MNISLIGGGKMGESIVRAVLDSGMVDSHRLRIAEPLKDRRTYLKKTFGNKGLSVEILPDAIDVIADADIVILSIQPRDLNTVIQEIKPHLTVNQAIVSIVAGALMKTLTTELQHKSVIRVMPNTPAQIGDGMIVWTASSDVSTSAIKTTREILETLGKQLYVADEKLVDMATALSASGPAYVFLFVESLIDAGVYLGMPRDMAKKLVLQTVTGSTNFIRESNLHPAQLKDMVASPGGTTVEALLTLENGGFRANIIEAVSAAYEKSNTLSAIR